MFILLNQKLIKKIYIWQKHWVDSPTFDRLLILVKNEICVDVKAQHGIDVASVKKQH